MIAYANLAQPEPHSSVEWQTRFLTLVPQIRRRAEVAFQAQPRDRRDELVAEVVANAYCAYFRLVERGKEDLAYATPLAMFAIRQVRSGRRVGGRVNQRDATSSGLRKKGGRHESLDRADTHNNEWREALIEDRRAGPAEVAAIRIDFGDWLQALNHDKRRLAETLALGETTLTAAKAFSISASRVSQLRRELRESWKLFQGDAALAGC